MKTSTLSKNNSVITLIIWWLFWFVCQTIIIHRFNFTWEIAFADAFISILILALAGYVTQSTYKFYSPGKENRLFSLGYGFALSFICTWFIQFTLSYIFVNDQNYLQFIDRSIPIRTLFALLMISMVIIMSWLLYDMNEKQLSSQRKSDAEILLRAAELASLRQQLQPHFLFNSLNSISALAGSKPEEARKMIHLLSDFLRGTIKNEDEKIYLFKDEIKHLNLYLEIEKVRFGYRLKTFVDIDAKCLELSLPSLLLQLVVENAIKFGLYQTIGVVEIILRAYLLNNMLCIEISNPYEDRVFDSNKGEGFGLKALQRRLELLYNRKDLLEINNDGKIFLTRIKIPQAA
ncbi:MAG: sensor histidine kinase [Bacteroidota bacterium]